MRVDPVWLVLIAFVMLGVALALVYFAGDRMGR